MKKNRRFQDSSVEELNVLYRELSKEIFEMRNEKAISRKLDKPHLLKQKIKDRARALTFIKQKGNP
jgi:large subunit ribosomal protein L29